MTSLSLFPKTLTALALAASTALALAADAAKPTAVVAQKVAAAASGVAQGVKLATLCDTCAVVQSTRVEKRKGKPSGVGAVGGAVVGGVVGNKTTDSTTGTVVGGVAGGLIGNEIEKRAKRHNVWITTVTMKDGSQRNVEALADPQLAAGTVVEVTADGQLKKR